MTTKMVKSLLLGSAAGVAAVAAAQAADLPVKAAPVQYVKICTLYGEGFYYIPGTDTCIKFGGYARADYNWNGRTPHVQQGGGVQDRTVSRYTSRHRANLTTDARTQTGYGVLRAYTSINTEVENNVATVGTHRAFIQWAGFTFGRTVSFVDHDGNFEDMRVLHVALVDSTTAPDGINQIAYTWQLGNGMTLNIGADAPRNGTLANLSTSTYSLVGASDPGGNRHGVSHPDPWVAFRVAQSWGRASVAFIGHNNQAQYYSGPTTGFSGCTGTNTNTTFCDYPDDKWGWAVLAGTEIKLDMLSPGSRVGFYGTYGVGASRITRNKQQSPGLYGSGNQVAFGILSDSVYVTGSQQELTTTWAVGGAFEYFWARNFSSTIYGGYTGTEYNSTVVDGRWFCGGGAAVAQAAFTGVATTAACDPSYNLWQVGTHHDWFPVSGFRLAVDVMYTRIDTAFDGQVLTLSKNAARPAGLYTVKDQGLTSVMFRA